jgi:hypothetical protein
VRSTVQSRLSRSAQARAALWLAEVTCPIPDPFENGAQRRRYCHEDLADLTHGELLREQLRVQMRLAVDPTPAGWLTDRERMVAIELLARTTGPAHKEHS